MNKFSKRLKNLREEHELTQEQLANILNITRSRLSMYEQGKREPTFEIQEAIADYFNVDLDYLMGRTDQKTDYIYNGTFVIDTLKRAFPSDALELYSKYLAADNKTRKMIDMLLEEGD